MKNYQEFEAVLFEQGYEKSATDGIFRIIHNESNSELRRQVITVDNDRVLYMVFDKEWDSKVMLSVSTDIEAFAIIHMLIYVGAVDAKKVFAKQLNRPELCVG